MTSNGKWTEGDIPDQTGRVAVVTGANSGIGFETARALAARGATVLLACRNPDRAAAARDRIRGRDPHASVETLVVDLGDLDSVATAAKDFAGRFDRLDLLINNAGVILMAEGVTAQGFETHIGVNHLGHFALTGRLVPYLLATDGSRVVTVASAGHRVGRLDPEDLAVQHPYKPMKAYARSKLANLLFVAELDRRLGTVGAGTLSVAAHPGGAKSDAKETDQANGVSPFMFRFRGLIELFLQPATMGALPTLRAATDPGVRGNDYFGPGGLTHQRGHPVLNRRSPRAQDSSLATRLWEASVEATGVDYAELAG
jgi:NAD(P)-dependent dehydrogenase (short-subunit alcohol dehydrogenase family)